MLSLVPPDFTDLSQRNGSKNRFENVSLILTKEITMKEEKKKIRWGAVIIEKDDEGTPKLSIGRVMGWILFGILVYMWIGMVPVPETIVTVFLTVMAYNFGKKLSGPLSGIMGSAVNKKMGAKEPVQEKKKEDA